MEDVVVSTEELREETIDLDKELIDLRNECEKYKQIILIMDQMIALTLPVITNCACDYNSDKIKTKLNLLKQKYDSLKDNNQLNNNSIINQNNLVFKLNNCTKISPKLIIKKNVIDEFGINENQNNNQQNGILFFNN
jgi:hypothetical protein